MEKNKILNPLILIFGIITLFIFIISFTVLYTTENFSSTCGCKLPIWVIIVSISSLGLFVGILSYYFLAKAFMKKEKGKDIIKLLDFFDNDERLVLNELLKNNGKINQSNLSKLLNINKVRTSRIISKLQEKDILKKEKNGMTNNIIINESIKKIFLG